MEEKDRDYYQKMRQDVMSDEEIREAERFLDYYKSSWRDKEQRGLFDKWERMQQYWEGEVNLPESETDPGSNANVVHPNIEGQVALLVDQNIAIEPQPITSSEAPYTEVVRTMAEWCKEQNRMRRKLDVYCRRLKMFGTGCVRVLFNPDALDGFGLPEIEPCNIAYVFTDPAITDIYRVQEGRFIIEVCRKSISWAREQEYFYADRVDAIMPGYDPIGDEWLFGEDEGESDEISRDTYLHMFVWTRKKGKLRLVEMSGCGVILRDSYRDGKPVFVSDKYPYFFTPECYREGTVHGKASAENLINLQDLIDDLDDQIRINARLAGNPQKLIDVGSGIDPDKWTNEPALNITCNDVNGAKWMNPPSLPEYILRRRDQALQYETQRVTRFSDQMTGQRQQGIYTATEALALQQAGASGIDHTKALIEETFAEAFEYALDLMIDNYEQEYGFSIPDKLGEFLWFNASQLKNIPVLMPASQMYIEAYKRLHPNEPTPKWMQVENEFKKAAFHVKVTVGAGLPKNKAFVYKLITENSPRPILTPEEARKLLRDYGGLPIEPTPPAPVVPPSPQGNPLSTLVEGLTQNNMPQTGGMPGVDLAGQNV